MSICPNCGKPMNGAEFCIFCGMTYSDPRQSISRNPEMESSTPNALKNPGKYVDAKADPEMIRVWSTRWALVWIGMLWLSLLGFIFIAPVGTLAVLGTLTLVIILIARAWANLYWQNYSYSIFEDRIVIQRGVIGKRKTMIPFDRIQNINIHIGIIDRIYDMAAVEIETAGGGGPRGGGPGYGTIGYTEGALQGLRDPEPIANYILAKIRKNKSFDGLGASPHVPHSQPPSDALAGLHDDLMMISKQLSVLADSK